MSDEYENCNIPLNKFGFIVSNEVHESDDAFIGFMIAYSEDCYGLIFLSCN